MVFAQFYTLRHTVVSQCLPVETAPIFLPKLLRSLCALPLCGFLAQALRAVKKRSGPVSQLSRCFHHHTVVVWAF